jgi:hypothetical protein
VTDIQPDIADVDPAEGIDAPEPLSVAHSEPATEVDPFESGADTFDRTYVEKLRNEAAARRTKQRELEEQWKPWQEALDGYDPDDKAAVLNLAKSLREDPDAAAAMMRRYLGLDEHEAGDGDPEVTTEAAQQAQKYLTAADFDRLLQEREAKAQQEAQVKAINDEAKGLGYKPDAERGTPEHRKFVELVYVANHTTGGDLAKAHEALEAETQAIIDRFVASREAAANGAPTPPQAGGAAPSPEREINNLDDARRAALERFGARPAVH